MPELTVAPREAAAPARENTVLAVLTLAALVFSMLQSLVVPALTMIQRDLAARETGITWVVTGMLLSSAVCTPILGRLGDMYGRGLMLRVSLLVLVAGIALAGVASSIGVLVVARFVQGAGGAIVPLSFGIVREQLPQTRVASSIGLISAMLAVGAATGIVLSGPIATGLGYRWLFWIPLVAMVPTTVLAFVAMPSVRAERGEALDLVGAVLLSGWLVCLLVGVSQGGRWGWSSARVAGIFAGAGVLLVAWVAAELRSHEPLVDIRLLLLPSLLRVNVVGFTTGIAMQATFTFVPRFVQIPASTGFGLGVSPSRAGLLVLPWSVGSFVTGMYSGRIAARHGSKLPLVVGCALAAVPLVLLATVHGEVWAVCVALGLFGTGMGLVAAAMPTLIVVEAPPSQTGVAAGMNQNIRTIGAAVGTQSIAAVIAAANGSDGTPDESGYVVSFVVLAVVCVVATLVALTVPSPRGALPVAGRAGR